MPPKTARPRAAEETSVSPDVMIAIARDPEGFAAKMDGWRAIKREAEEAVARSAERLREAEEAQAAAVEARQAQADREAELRAWAERLEARQATADATDERQRIEREQIEAARADLANRQAEIIAMRSDAVCAVRKLLED